MNKIIKVELDRMEQEAFEARIEARDADWDRHDDMMMYLRDCELLDWQEWKASKFANLLGN